MAQHAPVREHGREMIEREHRVHPRHRKRLVCDQTADRGMRMWAAHECRVQHVVKGDVVDEPPLAGKKRPILKPRNA